MFLHAHYYLTRRKCRKNSFVTKKTLKINGFTDFGGYTPLHQKNQKGDNALILMFQPFQGKWIQTVACLLSKGAACSSVLHQIIIKAIIQLEKSGFF